MQFYNSLFLKEFPKYYEKIGKELSKQIHVDVATYTTERKIVEDFLKSKPDVVLYGGLAMNKYLPADKKIYDERDDLLVDYDVYTPAPKQYAVELANQLFKAGIKFVSVSEGTQNGTYKIFANFHPLVDFSYIPAKVLKLMDNREMAGLKYISPDKIKANLYISLINPRHAIFRWQKDDERLALFESLFPYAKPAPNACSIADSNAKIELKTLQHLIKNYIDNNTKLILTGDIAYIFYMRQSGLKQYHRPNIKYVEVMSATPLEHIKAIQKIIRPPLMVKEYNQFLMYIPRRYIVSLKSNPQTILLIIYDLNDMCIPYVDFGGSRFISFDGLMLYYNFMITLSKLYGIHNQVTNSECCLYYLSEARKHYFAQHGIAKTDESIFSSFVVNCDGNSRDLLRNHKIRAWNKEKRFRYIPSKRDHLVEPDKVGPGNVRNISGEYSREIRLGPEIGIGKK